MSSYIVQYDFPEGCEEEDSEGCEIQKTCDKNMRNDNEEPIDPITFEPVRQPFYVAKYYKKNSDGDPEQAVEHTGECVNMEPLSRYFDTQDPLNSRKSIFNVQTVHTQLAPVLKSLQILARRMVTYIDDPTEERFEKIKDMAEGIDLEQLESPTEIPYEEGEDYKKRLLETLLDYFFNFFEATDTPEEKRCEALLEIIKFLVEEKGMKFRKDHDDDTWSDEDPFITLYYGRESLEENSSVDLASRGKLLKMFEKIEELLKKASMSSNVFDEDEDSTLHIALGVGVGE